MRFGIDSMAASGRRYLTWQVLMARSYAVMVQPPPSAAYYECKANLAREREAAQAKAEKEHQEQVALEDVAREAMYRVYDACGFGPKRPKPVKWELLSAEESKRLIIGGRP